MNIWDHAYFEVPNMVLKSVPEPLVSVRTTTCNHAPFIRKCIEGILAQKTSFPFEYLIGEDCSTDGTREIVMEYARKYPGIIRVVTSDQNVGGRKNGYRCRELSRGKYYAYCEGDDCWTDPFKLQKQIDFLESHPEFVGVGTDFTTFDTVGNIIKHESSVTLRHLDTDSDGNYLYNISYIPSTLTVVYRKKDEIFPLLPYFSEIIVGDWVYAMLMLRHGKIGYIPEMTATYNLHQGGIYSSKSAIKRAQITLNSWREAKAVFKKLNLDAAIFNSNPSMLLRSHKTLLRSYMKINPLEAVKHIWNSRSDFNRPFLFFVIRHYVKAKF